MTVRDVVSVVGIIALGFAGGLVTFHALSGLGHREPWELDPQSRAAALSEYECYARERIIVKVNGLYLECLTLRRAAD